MKTALALPCLAAIVLGCGSGGAGSLQASRADLPGTPVTVHELRLSVAPPPAAADIAFSGYAEPARLVIRSQDEWANAWRTLHAGMDPAPGLPAVDFATEMVVVVATGTRRSGGFHVAVTGAALDGGTLRVAVLEATPGAGCVTGAVMTQPAAAARLARHDGPVEFVDDVVATRCE